MFRQYLLCVTKLLLGPQEEHSVSDWFVNNFTMAVYYKFIFSREFDKTFWLKF